MRLTNACVAGTDSTSTTTTVRIRAHANGVSPKRPHAKHVKVLTGGHGPASVAHDVVTSTTTALTTPPTVDAPPPTPTTETTTTLPEPTTTVSVPPEPTTSSTTTVPTAPPSQSIQLSCTRTGTTQVTCTWTASPTGVAKYALWRWTTGGNGSDYGPVYESPDGLTFVDNNATGGPYTYRVFTTLADGSSGSVSNRSYIS